MGMPAAVYLNFDICHYEAFELYLQLRGFIWAFQAVFTCDEILWYVLFQVLHNVRGFNFGTDQQNLEIVYMIQQPCCLLGTIFDMTPCNSVTCG